MVCLNYILCQELGQWECNTVNGGHPNPTLNNEYKFCIDLESFHIIYLVSLTGAYSGPSWD